MSAALAQRRDLQEVHQASSRALAQFLADLPPPEVVAGIIPERVANALTSSHKAQGFWMASSEAAAAILRPWGFCDCGTNNRFLTAFGIAVRRELI